MFGIVGSLVDLASDVVRVAVTPIEIAVDVTAAVVKPIAEVAEEIASEVKDSLRE